MHYTEMLAAMGAGSAHPGGFMGTLELLSHKPIPAGSKVLEVGCGTGRTACHLAKLGCQVTAVDLLPAMLRKANKRAQKEGVEVEWIAASAEQLPLEDNQFDVVFVESVTLFTDVPTSLKEYMRVLKSGGVLYDREIVMRDGVPDKVTQEIGEFFRIAKMYTRESWLELLDEAGFRASGVWNLSPFPANLWEDQIQHPDEHQEMDENALFNQEVWQIAAQYDRLLARWHDCIGSGVMTGYK